jgi:hypothetical protein
MSADLGQSFGGNPPTTGDVLQEWHHLLRALRATEGHQQDCFVRRKGFAQLVG